jgi:hypothetical protein
VKAIQEISQRFVDVWLAFSDWEMLAVCVGVSLIFALWPRRLLKPNHWSVTAAHATLLVAVACTAAYLAWDYRWLCDDAFISFRYARNLVEGHGLVFNPGERVEGYTNFLWTLLTAGAIGFGLDAGQFALVLSMLSFGAALLISDRLCRRLAPPETTTVFPVAAVMLGLNYTFASFATSGLETMFAATLMIAAVERATVKRPLTAGCLGIAAVLSHPDHSILYASLGAVILIDRTYRPGFIRYAIPFVLVYLPYFAWRYSFYGDFFPNTFYAKSASSFYFSQGGLYLLISTLACGAWGVLPAVLLGAWFTRKSLLARYMITGVPLYLLYVAKVGGDFMLGRLLCSVLPPAAISAELGLRYLAAKNHRVTALVAMLACCVVVIRVEIVKPWEKFWHVADERTFYRLKSFSPVSVDSQYARWADTFNRNFADQGIKPRIAVGCVGIIGYKTMLPLVDTFGLTDRGVARMPISHRGRPGHEKFAREGYLFSRNVDVWDYPFYPPPYAAFTRVMLDRFNFYFAHYDTAIVSRLPEEHAHFAKSIKRYIERYLQRTLPPSPEVAACDLWFFEEYYFRKNKDRRLKDKLLKTMTELGVLPKGSENLFGRLPGQKPKGFEQVWVESFDSKPQEWTAMGSAFYDFPTFDPPVGQDVPARVRGGFVNTFQPVLTDTAKGRLVSPRIRLDGDFLTFQVAGGKNLNDLAVVLFVDGRPVSRATGCVTEIAGQRIVDVRPYKARTGHIEIVDNNTRGWGHIIVDEIALWKRE